MERHEKTTGARRARPAVRPQEERSACPLAKKCGGCDYQGMTYEEQLKKKEKTVQKLLKEFGEIRPIIGAEDPLHYRNKVHAVFARQRDGQIVSGIYQEGTHKVVPVDSCMIEDQKADEIIVSIRKLLRSFKIKVYDEDTDFGLLRHVLIRTGRATGQIMVVLVARSPVFPSKNNFVKALRAVHPEITTVVLNVNERKTSMVLGQRNITLYGRGYIEDRLCGCTFRISPTSFYQINPAQTERLYKTAMTLARLNKRDVVVDAYCGIGTIGMVAAKTVRQVIGVELNAEAVRDAAANARQNGMENIRFVQGDAGLFLEGMADREEKADVVFMDPPRSGSSEAFLKSLLILKPKKIVYISCNPETQARDLKLLTGEYRVEAVQPVDMFPWCDDVEVVCLLTLENQGK
ncbi:MAG: 23S rRNA (uracil(1939)-C(5))-methyltransferase RlmD [Eubacteriales bacterium]|nr:23S rRNA (uracil(1939)-C(5))-methyltransferase RlmD [Eubacteriales bacterium]